MERAGKTKFLQYCKHVGGKGFVPAGLNKISAAKKNPSGLPVFIDKFKKRLYNEYGTCIRGNNRSLLFWGLRVGRKFQPGKDFGTIYVLPVSRVNKNRAISR